MLWYEFSLYFLFSFQLFYQGIFWRANQCYGDHHLIWTSPGVSVFWSRKLFYFHSNCMPMTLQNLLFVLFSTSGKSSIMYCCAWLFFIGCCYKYCVISFPIIIGKVIPSRWVSVIYRLFFMWWSSCGWWFSYSLVNLSNAVSSGIPLT